jgi:hypothetical protein
LGGRGSDFEFKISQFITKSDVFSKKLNTIS